MSILNKLTQQGTPLSKNNGSTPSNLPLEEIIPVDSNLELDGATPPKYSDNLPQ